MKIRITAKIVKEYEPNPSYYPDVDPQAMLATDLASANNDPLMMFEDAEWNITGEIVENE